MEIVKLSLANECEKNELVIRADDLLAFLENIRSKYAHLRVQNEFILKGLENVELLVLETERLTSSN